MCSIGENPGIETQCTEGHPFKSKAAFSKDDWKILKRRSGCSHISSVCLNHELMYLNMFTHRHKFCCDPLNLHKGKKVSLYSRVTLSLSRKSTGDLNLVPGTGLCKKCKTNVTQKYDDVRTPSSASTDCAADFDSSDDDDDEGQPDDEWNENPYMDVVHDKLTGSLVSRPSSSPQASLSNPGPSNVSPEYSALQGPEPSSQEPSEAMQPNLSNVPPAKHDVSITSSESSPSVPNSQDTTYSSDGQLALTKLNQFLLHCNREPIERRDVARSASKRSASVAEATTTVKAVLGKISTRPLEELVEDTSKEYEEMINLLKEKLRVSTSRQEKVNVISLLPPEFWSISRIVTEFGVTPGFVRNVRKLVEEKGIFPQISTARSGRGLSADVLAAVQKFYDEDELYVHIFPDKFVSVKDKDGKKQQVSKRLLLGNLKELHIAFLTRHNVSIGFSKFAELRPKYCYLALGPGTHSVCVCERHENLKLMIDAVKLHLYDTEEGKSLKHYKNCLALTRCEPPTEECIFGRVKEDGTSGKCESCPGLQLFAEILEVHLDAEMMDVVQFNTWVSKPRCTLETVVKEKDLYIQEMLKLTDEIKEHDFLAYEQRKYLQDLKISLPMGEAIILMDFAENYRMHIQNEIQGFHWTNIEATIHPYVIYFRSGDVLKHLNFVIISDCLKHSAPAIYTFQKHMIKFVKEKIPDLVKIHYFSDSTTSQYRNKNSFSNLTHHKEDFQLDAEWNFFETSHGKSPCDGVGGNIKCCALKASLQNVLIRTPRELYDWAKNKWQEEAEKQPKIIIDYVTNEEVQDTFNTILKKRFEKALAVKNTFKIHQVVPINKFIVRAKFYSNSVRFQDSAVMRN